MARVRAENVSRIYAASKASPAVNDVSFDVADGEFLVLVGPSGCGKSTTLRLIAGLETPTRGDIWIGDRRVTDVAPSARDVAMVFQSYALYPHMTVRENMAFALTLQKQPRSRIQDRVSRAATMLGLEALLDRKPRQLSGGQRQRVALGRAIVREPAVFLFDEPLSNLDAGLRAQMRRELAALHRTLGTTMIYVTHDQVEAMTLGQRIAVMREGRLLQVDTPRRLYDHPADRFTAGFIGTPGMNFARGTIDPVAGGVRLHAAPDTVVSWQGSGAASARLGAIEVELGVRAEDLEVVEPTVERSANRVNGVVDYVETLGSDLLVHVAVGRRVGEKGATLLARASARDRRVVLVGDAVEVQVASARIHLFDVASGARLAE
ncbi:MAG: ABC transporter ATP-binding protein [Gemmatimonadaceae bacterium]|nr:ABC transporter ATP-binding protein [Gemmatimonadaceae bacterium]